MIISVRQWFRLARAAAWDREFSSVVVYFRVDDAGGDPIQLYRKPLTDPVRLEWLTDYQKLIDHGIPKPQDVQEAVGYNWSWHHLPPYDITK